MTGTPPAAAVTPAAATMRTNMWTNMAWPDDPYGTGHLWRKEPHLLAALATVCVEDGEHAAPVAHAVVYLRLHRTRTINATGGLPFGFRAVVALDDTELAVLLRLADLDVLRARRLAKIVAGYGLADDLHALRTAIIALPSTPPTGGTPPDAADRVGRGIDALAADWRHRHALTRGTAKMLDLSTDLDADHPDSPDAVGPDLADLAAASDIDISGVLHGLQPKDTVDQAAASALLPGLPPTGGQHRLWRQAAEWLAACAVERAALYAVIAARHEDRYTWNHRLDLGAAVAACVSDCFPTQQFSA